MEDRGDLDLAPPARRPAAAAAAPPGPRLGRPGTARDIARRDTESAPPRAAAVGYPGHDRALAPRYRPPPLGRQVHARQDRKAGHSPQHQGPGSSAGPGEPSLGIPQDPRRASRPGREGSRVDRVGDPEECRDRPCATADPARVVAVPALPGRGDPGMRLLHGRPARRHPGLCPGRDRARQQAHPHPRGHLAAHRGMDRSAGPEPDDGPRRASAPGEVHDPRPRLKLHSRIRRRSR